MLSQILKATILLITIIRCTTLNATTNISNSNITQSHIISGNNNAITTYNNVTKVYPLRSIRIDASQFEKQTQIITNKNAESALRNKRYQLAAEIWHEAYEIAIATKKAEKGELISLLENRSFAEEHFSKIQAYQTINEALNLDKQNVRLHKKAADLSIDNYQLHFAKHHLSEILKNPSITKDPKKHTALRFQVNQHLHAIAALEYRPNELIKHAIEASRIFIDEFSDEQQKEFKTDQVVLLQTAAHAGLDLIAFPVELASVYKSSFALINPERNPTHVGTSKKDVWLSLNEAKAVKLNNSSKLNTFSIFESTEDTPRYIIGEALERVLNTTTDASTWKVEFDTYNERDVVRHFLALQEQLSAIALECTECPISPISATLGHFFVGGAFESTNELELAHFYYSLALKKFRLSDQNYKTNPNYKQTLIALYEKIGATRKELSATHGYFINGSAITAPFSLATKLSEELIQEQNNNAKILAKHLQLLEQYGQALSSTFSRKEAEIQCSKSHDIFEKIAPNSYIVDEDVVKAYIGCTQTLLIGYHVFGDNEKYNKTIERFKSTTKAANIEVDDSVFSFIKNIN